MNIPLGKFSGSDATDQLRETIVKLAEQNTKQTQQLIYLTWVIVALTVAMLLAVAVQIAVAAR
jgi:hypothetical protein